MYNVTFSKCGTGGVNYHLNFAWSHYTFILKLLSTVSSKCSTELRRSLPTIIEGSVHFGFNRNYLILFERGSWVDVWFC